MTETLTPTITLLPRPRALHAGDGVFAIDAATPIQIAPGSEPATLHTARALQHALTDLLGLRPEIVIAGGERAGAIVLTRSGTSSHLPPQGHRIAVNPEGVSVTGIDEAGLFYGVQTLIQIATSTGRGWPALAITDWPALPGRGLMLDVSRGRVPTVASLTRLVETLAHYKINHLQLYTEHTFRFSRHPEIGRDAEGLSPDDILALDTVCRANHVELVPNLQSIGHQAALFKLPQYQHLAETTWNWSLATTHEGSFRLLDELYGDMLPAFSSPWFNVNADEPWDLGRGQSAGLAAEIGVGGVYLRHVQRLHDLVTRGHGRRMMMWADMFWYHPELVNELPDDIVFLDWWYEAKAEYPNVSVLANAGKRFWICPGTSAWGTLFPRLENAVANTRDFVRAGVAAGAEGMLLTEWGDGGHYQPPVNAWYPYLWGAECAWSGGTTERDDFETAFDRLFLLDGSGRLTAAMRRLGAATQTDPTWLTTWNTAMAFWEEPIDGALAGITEPEIVAETRAAAEALSPLLGTIRDFGLRHDLAMVTAQIAFATAKVETTRAIRAVFADAAGTDPGQRLDALIDWVRAQRNALPALIVEFENRWLATSRRSEMSISLGRYERLLTQYDDVVIPWLEGQRARLLAGESIAGALATYDRRGYAAGWEETRIWVLELAAIIGNEALPPDLQQWLRDTDSSPTPQTS